MTHPRLARPLYSMLRLLLWSIFALWTGSEAHHPEPMTSIKPPSIVQVHSATANGAAIAPPMKHPLDHPPHASVHHAHEEKHLMSGPTAVANVLADLCPHGMLPIGTCVCLIVTWLHLLFSLTHSFALVYHVRSN